MKLQHLKTFIQTLAISTLLTLPQNIIGCGPMMDPFDYYVSFFSKSTITNPGNQPFFYTALLDFYDDWEEVADSTFLNQSVIDEWQQYAGENATRKDVIAAVYGVKTADLRKLQTAFKLPNTVLPPSINHNSMLQAMLRNNKQDAINYLLLAKSIEPFCTLPDEWSETPDKDSLTINTYIKQAQQGWQQTTDSFLKNKYAFLRCKLAFYNNRLMDCIRWYEEGFSHQPAAAVQPMALSYQAGAWFRMGKGKEAAYAFSKTFATSSAAQKKNIFRGFLWATDRCNPSLLNAYSNMATTPQEKALLVGMFGLYGAAYHTNIIEKTFLLDANCPVLPLLVQRQINKIEEKYLTPKLNNQAGTKAFYYNWMEPDSTLLSDTAVYTTLALLEKMAGTPAASNRALYATGASYLSYILGDANRSRKNIATAKTLSPANAIADQLQLITLLLQTSEVKELDTATENTLLPSLQWLQSKAATNLEYGIFYRNFLSQILAPAYFRKGEPFKTTVAFGKADMAVPTDSSRFSYYGPTTHAASYLQNNLDTKQIEALYEYLTQKTPSAYDVFLMQQNSLNTTLVADMMATTYLRDANFASAIFWLQKMKKQSPLTAELHNQKTYKITRININPFHDYINDSERYQKPSPTAYSKLSFAQKMLRLQQELDTLQQPEAKAKAYYQLATGFYNMSYYGNSWRTVAYQRPSSSWNTGQYNAEWEKEYFGVYRAKEYYLKAYALSSNKEFKAAAYFLAAKCAQRQIARPPEAWEQYELWEKKMAQFQRAFHHNKMFAPFKKEFGSTKFYQIAYNRCSYLRDFATRNK